MIHLSLSYIFPFQSFTLSSVVEDYSYKEVRRWTVKAKIDIFELDYVIFPMNIGETHWAMGAIDLKDKGFRYFDSMFSGLAGIRD